jgi:hypothetical protein
MLATSQFYKEMKYPPKFVGSFAGSSMKLNGSLKFFRYPEPVVL